MLIASAYRRKTWYTFIPRLPQNLVRLSGTFLHRYLYHQPRIRRMEQRIHRRQNDYSAAGSTYTSLPHHRNRQRVFPLQTKYSQCKDQNTAAGKRKILTRRKSGRFVVNYNKLKHQQEVNYQPSLVDLSTDA